MKCSNSLVGFLNFLTLMISFIIIFIGMHFRKNASTQCEQFLQLPLLTIGLFLLVVSLLGFFGACCRVSAFLWIYLFVMFMLILGMIVYTLFVLIVTNKGASDAISSRVSEEYKIGDYSNWLQNKVQDWKTWREIEGCLQASKVCGNLVIDMGTMVENADEFYKINSDVDGVMGKFSDKANEFYKTNLSPIQSGCCAPPKYCGYVYVNATYWTVPKDGLKSKDVDCTMWSNDQERLCFDCNSCKAGVLATINSKWKELAIFNSFLIIFLMIVYSVGCCAYRNSKYRHYHRNRYY